MRIRDKVVYEQQLYKIVQGVGANANKYRIVRYSGHVSEWFSETMKKKLIKMNALEYIKVASGMVKNEEPKPAKVLSEDLILFIMLVSITTAIVLLIRGEGYGFLFAWPLLSHRFRYK
jgi:hypothetical protein